MNGDHKPDPTAASDEIDPLLRRMIEGKQAMRKRLAALSFTEKVRILEKLRDREKVIAAAGLSGRGQKMTSRARRNRTR